MTTSATPHHRPAAPRRRVGGVRVALVVLMLLATAAGGCAHRPGGPSVEGEESAAPVGAILVLVDNRSQYGVTIYAVRGSLRTRIGTVNPVSTADMAVPDTYTNDHGGVTLQVLQIGGPQRYVSDVVAPQHGDRLMLTVQVRLSSSTLTVQQ